MVLDGSGSLNNRNVLKLYEGFFVYSGIYMQLSFPLHFLRKFLWD